jgi:alpha-N-acetylglucosamine transferase
MWNMTQFSKILYMDADLLPVRPMSAVFETPSAHNEDGEEYLFAATYDSAGVRDFGKFTRPIPNLGPSDTSAASEINAGLFLLQPSERQAAYVQSIYNDVSVSQHFTDMMEQGLLRYAYRDDGKYPWIRLSQMYNTQWPRLQDLDVSRAVHDKMWKDDSPVNWELRRFWYFAWGEMRGRASNREGGE